MQEQPKSMDELPMIFGDFNLRQRLQDYFPHDVSKQLVQTAKNIYAKVIKEQTEKDPTLKIDQFRLHFPKYALRANFDDTFTLIVITTIDDETDIYTEVSICRKTKTDELENKLPQQPEGK
jgi:excinuclease UvrABC nuclease subunit